VNTTAPALLLALLSLAAGGAKPAAEDAAFALDHIEKKAGHFFRQKGIDWRKVRAEIGRTAAKADGNQAHYEVLVRLVARLRDGHAYVKAADSVKDLAWPGPKFEKGPGLFFCTSGSKVLVKNSWAGAEAGGVSAGMEVLEVDDLPARKWLDRRIEEISDTSSFSTDQQAEYFACHWGLAGEAGSTLKVKCRGLDGRTKQATLTRNNGSFVAQGPAFMPGGLQGTGRQAFGRTKAGLGYIHLRDTPQDLPAQVDAMLKGIGDVPGLILDFRANGGGGFDHEAFMGRFVAKGKVLNGGGGVRYESAGENPFAGPVVVIVDAGVRSAGETASGIFKEDGRARMIGESATAGMSSSKETLELPSGLFSIYFSVAGNKGRFNGGRGIEGIGVVPDPIVPYDPKDLAAGVDTLIQRAEDLLR
jgi:carboxyl-terminal processing protease